jgi:hypothetical protein
MFSCNPFSDVGKLPSFLGLCVTVSFNIMLPLFLLHVLSNYCSNSVHTWRWYHTVESIWMNFFDYSLWHSLSLYLFFFSP